MCMEPTKYDIRWAKQLDTYYKAFAGLERALSLSTQRDLSDLEKQGLVKYFEWVYFEGGATVKDFFIAQGDVCIETPADAFRLAFRRGLVKKGELLVASWELIPLSKKVYEPEVLDKVFFEITNKYFEAFEELRDRLVVERRQRQLEVYSDMYQHDTKDVK